MSSSITKDFTGLGTGGAINVPAGHNVVYTVSGTYVGGWELQKSIDGGQSFQTIASGTGNVASVSKQITTSGQASALVRFVCTAYTSGTLSTVVANASTEVSGTSLKDDDGIIQLEVTEDGVNAPNGLTKAGVTVSTLSGSETLTGKTLTSPVINTPVMTRTGRQVAIAHGAAVGQTAGWLPGQTTTGPINETRLAALPASKSFSTLVVPLELKVGDILTGINLLGRAISAGATASLDLEVTKLTPGAGGMTETSLGTLSSQNYVANTVLSASNTQLTLGSPETIAAGSTYYLFLTGTTAALTGIDLLAVVAQMTEK